MRTIFKIMARNNYEDSGVFQKIQSKTGCLFLVIGIAMLAFVMTDLIKGSSFLGSNNNDVGEIAGTTIEYEAFQNEMNEVRSMYAAANPNSIPGEDEIRIIDED